MTTFSDIPINLILCHVPELDINTLCSLLVLEKKNKDTIDTQDMQINAYASYYRLFPSIVENYERVSKTTFYTIMDNGSINIVKIFNILSQLDNIIDRKKNQRYKHILKPLIDGSLFLDNPYQNKDSNLVDLNTMTFIVVLYHYIYNNYRKIINNTKILINLWFYIFILDYLLLVYEKYHNNKNKTESEIPKLLSSQFRNIQKLIYNTKENYKIIYCDTNLGDKTTRITNKLEKLMYMKYDSSII